ncbi:universal stress protein [Marinomonas transparens]|uniref:Universal stress protein n=1 Tax=Marinomonas transparens TaxID=2795388 RepID=A0A934JIJ5_9GAMM|nr:universal stress protein [Marinomonas transparens]MBJ7536685.1 universal stress protein [Marinomonas transparens]
MLPKITTILYAYDLDGKTHDTMELVMSLALAHQAKIILMHSMEPLGAQTANMINNYIPAEDLQSMRKEAKADIESRLKKSVNNLMQEYSEELANLPAPPETVIVYGTPADSIDTVAKERNVDMIIMNSRTHSRLGQMIIGSTANKIIHSSSIPVLVVPIK